MAKKLIVLLVAIVVLVVAGAALAYAVNTYPAHPYAASNGGDHEGDHQGTDDMFFLDGLDRLLGDTEDFEERD